MASKGFSLLNIFITSVFLLSSSLAWSQNTLETGVILNVKLIPPPNQHLKKIEKAYLGYYKGKDFKLIDSAMISPDHTCILRTLSNVYGVYEIDVSKQLGMPVVVTSVDKQLNVPLNFRDSTFIELPQFNRENKAFAEISLLSKSFNESINSLRSSLTGLNEKMDWREKMDSVRKQQDTLIKKFNEDLLFFKQSYPGTYASEFIANLFYYRDMGAGDIRFIQADQRKLMQEHFFDKIPMQDERVLYNPFFYDKLVKYLTDYSGRETEGFKKCVDELMGRASANPIVKEYVLQFLIDIFIENGPDEVLFYISDNYLDGCTNNVPEVTVKRIKQRKEFRPGMPAPEISLPDTSGKMVSLYSLIGKQPVLLYFWSSSCTHCQQETPEYVKLYNQFKDKGLKVYAVSLDEKKENWTNAIRDWGLNWINVSDFGKFDSPAAKTYHVFATPAAFLLDGQEKIVSVNPEINELKKSLDIFFNKN